MLAIVAAAVVVPAAARDIEPQRARGAPEASVNVTDREYVGEISQRVDFDGRSPVRKLPRRLAVPVGALALIDLDDLRLEGDVYCVGPDDEPLRVRGKLIVTVNLERAETGRREKLMSTKADFDPDDGDASFKVRELAVPDGLVARDMLVADYRIRSTAKAGDSSYCVQRFAWELDEDP